MKTVMATLEPDSPEHRRLLQAIRDLLERARSLR